MQWAEAIECREDVGFQPEYLVDSIALLANPELHGERWKSDVVEMYVSMTAAD